MRPGQRWTGGRLRDLASYLLIATVVSFGIVWFANNSAGNTDELIPTWGGLMLNTAILYGYVVKESRPLWHSWGFWLAIISALIAHLLAFMLIFQHVEHWSVMWFLFLYPIEIPLLAILCDWAVHVTGGKPRYARRTRREQ